MKRVVVSNSIGRLKSGRALVLFPSRWTAAVESPSRPFTFYPYELAYCSALLKRELPSSEYAVRMVDPNVLGLDQDETVELLCSLAPDYLVVEPSPVDSPELFEVLARVKQRCGTVTIVVGAYPQAAPEECQRHADFVVPGEFEETVLEIIRSGASSSRGVSIPGVYPTKREHLVNLNNLPWPEDDDICRLDYTEPGCDARMIQLYASRGCARACTFCVAPTYYGGAVRGRVRDSANVVAEIRHLLDKYGGHFSGIFFNEEAHNTSRAWLGELCHAIIDAGLNHLMYDAMCVYYNFDDGLLKLMRQAGYHQIRVGIETFDERTVRGLKKNVQYEKTKKFLQNAKAHGFVTYGTSIVGAQESTFESDLATHNALCGLREEGLLDKWQVSIATPQPGTEFYRWASAGGYIVSHDLSQYNGRQAVCSYPTYSSPKIELMYRIGQAKQPVSPEKAMSMAATLS